LARYKLASRVRDEVHRLLDLHSHTELSLVSSMPGPSEIAEEVYRNLARKNILPSRPVADFDDFAHSMARAGIWAEVSIYTSADDGTGLKDAVVAALREFGLASAVEESPIRGSWFQRFWARSRQVRESEPVRERLAKLERALELAHLGKPQAEIDKEKAESVAALYSVVHEQNNAVVRMGSIIMIKTGTISSSGLSARWRLPHWKRTANCCATRWQH
jgi:hypothetical protein